MSTLIFRFEISLYHSQVVTNVPTEIQVNDADKWGFFSLNKSSVDEQLKYGRKLDDITLGSATLAIF